MADEEAPTYQSATRDVLITSAKLIFSKCVDVNLAFTRCKNADTDPEACLKQGEAVLECGNSVFRQAFKKCPAEFEAYRKCLDKTQMNFSKCREAHEALEAAFSS